MRLQSLYAGNLVWELRPALTMIGESGVRMGVDVPEWVWDALAEQVPRGAAVRVLASGWDSDALLLDGRIVVKRPKHAAAEGRLRTEAALLALVGDRVALPVPALHLIEGPTLWSWHRMLPGEQLLTAGYDAMTEGARQRLARDLGQFLAELHLVGVAEARAVGALGLPPWRNAKEVRLRAVPVLPETLHDVAVRVLAGYDALPPDPLGQVYGHFDGHGWNMAFDADAQVLNGIYDFADSGIGPRHQEFIYAGLISFDLMQRTAAAYEAASGLTLDHGRIALLAGMHRLWELAEAVQSGAERADYVTRFAQWCAEFAEG
jgi:aminoglycoside phosphotransferase (APT) family kinase protein